MKICMSDTHNLSSMSMAESFEGKPRICRAGETQVATEDRDMEGTLD